MMQYVEDTDLMKIMTTYNLNPVRVSYVEVDKFNPV